MSDAPKGNVPACIADTAPGYDHIIERAGCVFVPFPGILESVDLSGRFGAVAFGKQHVVGGV